MGELGKFMRFEKVLTMVMRGLYEDVRRLEGVGNLEREECVHRDVRAVRT